MGSLSDSFADAEKEKEEKNMEMLRAQCRASYKKELDTMDFDDLHWLWDNKQKILAQRELINMIGRW